MKRKEREELKNRSEDELRTLVKQDREKLREVQFDRALGKLKSVVEARRIRKRIAVALTLLRQKMVAPRL